MLDSPHFVSDETKKNPGILCMPEPFKVIHVSAKVGIFFQMAL